MRRKNESRRAYALRLAGDALAALDAAKIKDHAQAIGMALAHAEEKDAQAPHLDFGALSTALNDAAGALKTTLSEAAKLCAAAAHEAMYVGWALKAQAPTQIPAGEITQTAKAG